MPNCDSGNPRTAAIAIAGSSGHSTTSSFEEHTETDNVTAIELQRNRRILYFCDGTMEELSDSENETTETDGDVTDKCLQLTENEEKLLPLVPRLKYKASRVGSNILAGIDYVGGGLASFLGISTPKYASEIEYYKRQMTNADEEEEDQNETWRPTDVNKNLNEVITNVPNGSGNPEIH